MVSKLARVSKELFVNGDWPLQTFHPLMSTVLVLHDYLEVLRCLAMYESFVSRREQRAPLLLRPLLFTPTAFTRYIRRSEKYYFIINFEYFQLKRFTRILLFGNRITLIFRRLFFLFCWPLETISGFIFDGFPPSLITKFSSTTAGIT